MRCPSCGAGVSGAFCEYCGAKMPAERVETHSIHADNVVVNNYYYQEPQAAAPSAAALGSGAHYGNAGANSSVSISASAKSRLIALLLCFFLGIFGAHRFYVGRIGLGLVYFFTFGIFGIGWVVDFILLLLGRMRDKYWLPVVNW